MGQTIIHTNAYGGDGEKSPPPGRYTFDALIVGIEDRGDTDLLITIQRHNSKQQAKMLARRDRIEGCRPGLSYSFTCTASAKSSVMGTAEWRLKANATTPLGPSTSPSCG